MAQPDSKKLLNLRLLLVICSLLVHASAQAVINIQGINLQYPENNRVQVILTADSRFDYTTFKLGADSQANKLPRLVIDAYDTHPRFWLGDNFQRLFQKDPLLKKIRVGKDKVRDGRRFTRIVIDIRNNNLTTSIQEAITASGNYQLIIEFSDDSLSLNQPSSDNANQPTQASPASNTQAPPNSADQFVIIIDPGHGGRDPGAVAVDAEILEKNITFSISQKLHSLLQQDSLFDPQLTRDSDSLPSLKDRLKKAHSDEAHMFISIHADSFPWSESVRGASVYTLAAKKSDNQLANLLAQSENSVDERYGLSNLDSIDDDEAKYIARELQVQSIANASTKLAQSLIASLAQVRPIFNKEVHEGPFYVLRSAYTPSVLIEVGFLSNLQEAQELTQDQVQQQIAEALHQGIRNYANKYIVVRSPLLQQITTQQSTPINDRQSQNNPTNSAPAGQEVLQKLIKPAPKSAQHTVIKGETFLSISKRYSLTEQQLRQANAKYQGIIFPGDTLLIPTP